MRLFEVTTTLAEMASLARITRELRPRSAGTRDCLGARMEATAARYPEHSAVVFEGRELSWRELNQYVNRYASALHSRGLGHGDVVSIMLENRIEYLAAVIALNKLGATAALLNTNLTGAPLAHCMSITECSACIFGEERLDAIASQRSNPVLAGIAHYLFVPDGGEQACPGWAQDLAADAARGSPDNPPQTRRVVLGDTALYIFTSGTTGLPKAAVVSNRRLLLSAAGAHAVGLRCDVNDRIYLCLPLYHGTGLFLGLGAACCSGASMFLRRRFSASRFLDEVREHGTTCFVYIGELCRYLLNTPPRPDDYRNPLGTAMGNGLRPDAWHEFKTRFGINRVAEFYGASEGNVGFINFLNKDCTVGASIQPVALVSYDVGTDEIVRDRRGHCIRVAEGEPGLLLARITALSAFEGYTSKEATEQKILRNVFRRGDAWFNTGDLMRTVDVGFALHLPHYQFVDRVGDTFRWKSENVSTNEVGEIINQHPQIAFCNVYGVEVPRAEGRAGMAALALVEGVRKLDLASFSAHVNERLPAYARPVFLRIQRELDNTGTFKLVKGELRSQGYDPALVSDTIYVMKPGVSVYEPLDSKFFASIRAGRAGF